MVSKDLYKDSYDELIGIRNGLRGDSFNINMNKLDPESREIITQSLLSAIAKRLPEISATMCGNN